jgi:PAS domain S-box-containing protein
VTEEERRPSSRGLHEAAWPDMFANLQSAYAELAQAQFELQGRASEIQAAHDLFEQVVASMSEALFLLDHTGHIVRVNPAATALLGRPEAELARQSFATLCGAADVPTNPWQLLHRAPTGALRDLEFEIPTRAGTSLALSTSWALVRDKRGKIIGMLAVARDITARKREEEGRARLLAREQAARRLAEEASRSKDEFLATVSHELRTPLNAMIGWVDMLRAGVLDGPTTARALETVERNMKLQTQLVEDLLDVSRIISGKLRLDVKPVHLVAIIEAAIESVRPAATAKTIEVQTVFEPLTDPVVGDPDRLQQIVWNLLSNAIKFTPQAGRVVVRLERRDEQTELTVRDSGKGISPDFLPFVFDRFRQADSSSTRVYGGLGLGLAIVRHLVELHGGTVSVESAGEGHGATFTVRLPFMPLRTVGALDVHPTTPPGSLPATQLNLTGLRVLIVDDSSDERELFTIALERHGAAVTAAASVAEAVKAFEETRPEVIVSDISMPGEDGYDLIRRVRASGVEGGGRTPAVALTAYASAADRQRTLLAGFHLHLAKPVDATELATVVARLAGRV